MRWLIVCLCLAAAQAASADKAVIRVVGPDGRPIAGAQVLVSSANTCPAPGLPTPKTDRSGRYTTTFTGRAAVYVWSPGFVQAGRLLKKGDNLFKLERAGKVSGTVVDKQGKPVAGASVSLWYVDRPDGSHFSFS